MGGWSLTLPSKTAGDTEPSGVAEQANRLCGGSVLLRAVLEMSGVHTPSTEVMALHSLQLLQQLGASTGEGGLEVVLMKTQGSSLGDR